MCARMFLLSIITRKKVFYVKICAHVDNFLRVLRMMRMQHAQFFTGHPTAASIVALVAQLPDVLA